MYFFEIIDIEKISELEYNSFEKKTIFTTIPWIQFVAETNNASPLIVRIVKNNELVGYFTGLLISKFGIKILGSPFKGWSTCFMGFDLFKSNQISEILPSLVEFLFNNIKCHFIECVDRNISELQIKNIPFKSRMVDTLELDLDRPEEEIYQNLKGDCRTFLKQFEVRGATIEIARPDDIFASEYYDQLKDVFAKQNLVPTYGLEKVRKLIILLQDTNMLLCLRVKDPNGKSIGSSIFLGYKNKFFFWGGASYRDSQKYRPNETMIWYAIKYWRKRGVKTFDMVGVRDYKLKFGSERKEYISFIITKTPVLIFFRDFAEKIFFKLLKIQGSRLKKSSKFLKYNNLSINEIIDEEIAHYADNNLKIFSRFNKVTIVTITTEKTIIQLPISTHQRILGKSRLLRRLLRLDKSHVMPTNTGYVAFWQGNVYHISKDLNKHVQTLKTIGSRNPLHNSVANVDGNNLYFGEYGQPHSEGKSIYHSSNGGITWEKVLNISCDKIRHIHACKWDPYEQKIWVLMGDFDGQCYILCADKKFEKVEWIGDGTQYYRAVDAVFEKDTVHWIMDSPLIEVRHVRLDRKTRTISFGQTFPGPVWYLKQLNDGVTLACSVQEVGPSHMDNKVHLFATRNLKKWVDVAQFEHDGLKKGIMKFGVGAFADGSQSSDGFFMHFEAIEKLDGKVCFCSLIGI